MPKRMYMVVESFKNKDAVAVYRRFRDKGRLAPEGVSYVSSWVDDKLERCYQLMECDDRRLLDEWIANWSDLVDFEVHAVITSKEAARRSRHAYSFSSCLSRGPPPILHAVQSIASITVGLHWDAAPWLVRIGSPESLARSA